MRILIVEDDYGSRRFMQKALDRYGDTDIVVDGKEAIEAFRIAIEEQVPYNLIFMDIMMPKVDGHEAMRAIREIEHSSGVPPFDAVKIIMTTVMEDPKNVINAFHNGGAEAYLVKPIDVSKIHEEMKKLGYHPRTG